MIFMLIIELLLCLYKFLKGSKAVSPRERKFQAWTLERTVPPRAAGFNSDLSETHKYWLWGQSGHNEGRAGSTRLFVNRNGSAASKRFPASSHKPKPRTAGRRRSGCRWTMQCCSSPKPNFQTVSGGRQMDGSEAKRLKRVRLPVSLRWTCSSLKAGTF